MPSTRRRLASPTNATISAGAWAISTAPGCAIRQPCCPWQDLTTQQQGWLVIAAGILLEKSGPVTVTANGKPQPPAAVVNLQKPLEDLGELTVRNDGTGSVTRMVSVRGLPVDAPPA
jgi:hypothetical protein